MEQGRNCPSGSVCMVNKTKKHGICSCFHRFVRLALHEHFFSMMTSVYVFAGGLFTLCTITAANRHFDVILFDHKYWRVEKPKGLFKANVEYTCGVSPHRGGGSEGPFQRKRRHFVLGQKQKPTVGWCYCYQYVGRHHWQFGRGYSGNEKINVTETTTYWCLWS